MALLLFSPEQMLIGLSVITSTHQNSRKAAQRQTECRWDNDAGLMFDDATSCQGFSTHVDCRTPHINPVLAAKTFLAKPSPFSQQ